MKILLSGYEGSKFLLPASSWLIHKYIPDSFDIRFLNYGEYTDRLFCGRYDKLADKQVNGSKDWAKDLRNYLAELNSELVILALDDYLLSAPMDQIQYMLMRDLIESNPAIVCARLCISDFYKPHEFEIFDDDVIVLTDKAQYSATTQYCIWRREFLMDLLSKVNTPWEFEIEGSRILNEMGGKVIGLKVNPPLIYPDCSALSSKWNGIRTEGNNPADIAALKEHRFL